MTEPLGHALIALGALFGLVGGLAALRLPTYHARLSGGAKAMSAGLLLLFAGTLFVPGFDRFGILAGTSILVVLIATPVLTALLARKPRPLAPPEPREETARADDTTVDMAAITGRTDEDNDDHAPADDGAPSEPELDAPEARDGPEPETGSEDEHGRSVPGR
jgi:multisubunit Na+/H+ antiporter MnhG subunit